MWGKKNKFRLSQPKENRAGDPRQKSVREVGTLGKRLQALL